MLNDYLEQLLLARYDYLFSSKSAHNGTIADIGDVVGGATPSKKKPEYYCHDGIGWITPRDLSNTSDKFIAHGADDITQAGFDSCSVKKLPAGTVLFSSRAPIGYIAIATDNVTTNQGFKSVVPHKEIGTAFVYCFLVRNKDRIADAGSGTTFPEVSGKTMASAELTLPDVNLCAEFEGYATPLLEQQRCLEEESRQLGNLRDALLPKLMSGEIDVSRVDATQLNNHFLLQSSKLEFKCIIQYPFSKQTLPNRSMLQPCDLGEKMNETLANQIANKMSIFLNSVQMKALQNVLAETFKLTSSNAIHDDRNILDLFLQAKKVEGCSPQTIKYYQSVIQKISDQIQKPFPQITTEDLRNYLDSYQERKSPSRVTLDNIRRIMSTFFSWLEDEEYIVKSPVRRIKRVKTISVIKETFTDEQIEIIRDGCPTLRDRAIIELLSSTGIRIGELVRLNKTDINFLERECIVLGKGNKERRAYFDAKTKIYLERYLKSRNDNNPALFVGFNTSHKRLTIGAIEDRLRSIGKRLGVNKVYPHKFRRTLATNAIDRGMPIEQVQKLLGHSRIDTTMHYALVNESNVKASHRRYLT